MKPRPSPFAAAASQLETMRLIEEENALFPEHLVEIPVEMWPPNVEPCVTHVRRSRDFLVQEYAEEYGVIRLSINRTKIKGFKDDGRLDFADGITWDELQRLKAECGYAERCAVEIYPPESELVCVSNIRHLWLLEEPPFFMWKDGR